MVVATGQRCGQPASVVDHIIPHRGDRARFWDRTNWQPLCTHCHASRKQSAEQQTGLRRSACQFEK
ncbi:HNH endonuclease [Rhodopseudomonas sp. P2A-2r]|uniref:HNH endonuclease signature motif containing protein n=1 Tax=Rhodopseudomonas sp. P2A-2r TaxID=2991972 RepID=UPI0029FEEEE2|nr:HNH endonuclease [Rhodopseudomonas sp. P2A-2r]